MNGAGTVRAFAHWQNSKRIAERLKWVTMDYRTAKRRYIFGSRHMDPKFWYDKMAAKDRERAELLGAYREVRRLMWCSLNPFRTTK